MNTTFTTYAEKKAKQFLNLLQGYTKGIRITTILILLLMGVSNAWAVNITGGTTLYLELKGGNEGWDKDGARFAAYFCNGTSDAKWYSMPCRNSDGKYYVTVDSGESHKNVIFCRMNGNNQTNNWDNRWNQSGNLTWDGTKNLFVINNFSDDTWYSYTAPDYTYTIVGNKNIAGSDWNTNDSYNEMTRQDDGTYTLTKRRHNLNAENYEYKVVRDHNYDCWQCPASGNNTLNIGSNGLYDITFTLNPSTNQLTAVATPTPPTTIYLKLNSKWKQGNERFAVYAFESGEEWFDMSDIGCNGDYYTCTIPAKYPKFILCRMNGGTTSNNWDNKWDQTPDLYVSDTYDNKNLYTLTDNQNDGSWSSSLQTITTNASAGGSISVSPSTTVELGSEITVTFTPNSGYKIKSYTIAGETTNVAEEGSKSVNLTICGPTDISAEFEPKANPVIYLRPNDTWLSDGAVFAAYVWKSSNDSEHEWLELTTKEDDFTGAYSATIPSKYDRVIFARFQPETTSFGFNNGKLWNQTINLHMTLDNLEEYGYRFAITDDNKVDGKFNGAWEQNTAIWGIKGSFNGWRAENAVLKGYEGTTTVELDAQDYEFKLYNFPHEHHYGNTGTMLRGGSENWQMDYNGVNCGIKADMEGDYVFKLKFTTDNSTLKKRVTVVYPEKVFVVKGLLAAYEINQGETYTITPKVILPDGKQENNVELVVIKTSGNENITATASGLNIKITGTAADNATFKATYTLDDKSYEFTFIVTVVADDKVTIQVKVPTNFGDEDQYQWKDPEQIKIHYWGNGISDRNITMTYLSTVNEHIILQARVPKGTDNKTNFLVYYGYYDNDQEKWRKTDDVKNVSSNGCYLLWKEGADKYHRGITREGAKCTEYFQVEIVMGSGKTFYSNALYNADQSEILSFFAPGESEIGYKKGSVKLLENGIAIANIPASSFAVSGVYTATLNANKDGLENIALYEGDYYIRTDGASGMWSDYLNPEKNNKMTYFIPREYEKYDHYWAESITPVDNKVNIKACVANQYNEDLANMLTKDRFTNDDGNVECSETANVRFGYNPSTNHFERAVLKGSTEANFLNIISDQIYKEEQCNTKLSSANGDSQFTDQSNWVYEKDVYVRIENNTSSAEIVISSTAYNGEVNHLLGYEIDPDNGNETTTPKKRTIVGSGTDAGIYMIRTIYDFKTNRMIMAWVPSTQDITGEKTINADVLFIRHEQEAVPQLTLGTTGSVRSLEGVFFALELNRDEKNYRQEEHYWISLPFDCKVGSISGVPGYMTTWGIQRYRGDLRAKKGWFKETPTFWEWMGLDDTMNAGEGYVLSFDKRLASWKEIGGMAIVRLYFPAMSNGFDFTNSNDLLRTYENQPCTITRDNRHIQDSNWKVIGTLSYNNATASSVENTNPNKLTAHPSFVYEYQYGEGDDNSTKNPKYNPVDGEDYAYKSFHGYMVQFAGTITWNSLVASAPEQLAARRNTSSMPTNVTMRLELVDGNDVQHDQTFVALDEDGTTTFDQNKDLNKVLNTGYANIYTLSEGIPFAGNTLPMAEVIVPVGVKIDAEGEYTFRMPDGTEGMVVELIDYETGTTTNMLLSDYTVTLSKGTHENRFALHVQPEKQVGTGVENIGENGKVKTENGKPNKFLIDGKLVIRTAEGAVYDAQGHVVQ